MDTVAFDAYLLMCVTCCLVLVTFKSFCQDRYRFRDLLPGTPALLESLGYSDAPGAAPAARGAAKQGEAGPSRGPHKYAMPDLSQMVSAFSWCLVTVCRYSFLLGPAVT